MLSAFEHSQIKLSTSAILYTDGGGSLVKVGFFWSMSSFSNYVLMIFKNIFITGYDQFFCNFQLVIGKYKLSAIVI